MPDYPASPAELTDPAITDPSLEDSIDPPPDTTTLARRIQALLAKSSIPSPFDAPPNEPESSKPPTHPPPQLVSDPKLVTLLSSPAVMNGTVSKGGQSVWTVLDKLRTQLPLQGSSPAFASKPKDNDIKHQQAEASDDDDSGFMVYGPLIPDKDSRIELAKSEYVPSDEGKRLENRPEPGSQQGTSKLEPLKELKDKIEGVWPFKGNSGESINNDPSNARVYFQGGKSKRVWIPSPDQISIQVMWWGYRM